jgi:hypothetical protein
MAQPLCTEKTTQDFAGICGPNHAKKRLKSSEDSKIPVFVGPKPRTVRHHELALLFISRK